MVAHPDDDLLFLSPALLVSLWSGVGVHTVFLTAGDAGNPTAYWRQRELGIRAAYAGMVGTADNWALTASAPLSLALVGAPQVKLTFLRLPDGGPGAGYPRYSGQSLPLLWRRRESTITAVDRSASYTRASLIATLLDLMRAVGPATIRTQDFTRGFGGGDHNDHRAAAYLTRAASQRYTTPHALEAYQDYPIASRRANVTGALLTAKTAAFTAYAGHDPRVCVPGTPACVGSPYPTWIRRQYLLASG